MEAEVETAATVVVDGDKVVVAGDEEDEARLRGCSGSYEDLFLCF